VENGAPAALVDEHTPVDSPGARLIIDEGLRDDQPGPLTIGFLGPLTDMASAVLLEPAIVDREVVVIWIGGPPYNGVQSHWWPEYNLMNDRHAANVVIASGLRVIQVPVNLYTQLCVSHDELERRIGWAGAIGRYLVDQLVAFNQKMEFAQEFRTLGDSPTVGLMISRACASLRTYPARRYNEEFAMSDRIPDRTVDVVETLDTRFILEDMFSKLANAAPGASDRMRSAGR
jgi:inosine-uridine nucleoside N-ribohydrolase